MMAKNKMQMVDDDEIENVGIMAGFMDDMDGMMEEIIAEEMDGMDGENDEMARATGRSPDSPEILMNNLRGNMRSLDARREELADLVGYNAAAETPEEVLAMLQPVLAQQEAAGIASMMPPAQPPMPPEGMMPPMPEGMMPPMPPEGMMPPQGLASLAPPPMPMDQAPMQMAYGGMVQSFQEGSDPAGVTPIADAYSAYPQEVVEASINQLLGVLAQEPRETTDLIQLTKQLQPQYQELLGVDPEAAKAEFLMGLGQSALRYAGNVSPEGEALSGSPMARLAGGFSDVPAKAAAASSLIQKQEQNAKLAALQGAQAQQSADVAYNTELMGQQFDIAQEIAKQKKSSRLLNEAEIALVPGLDPNLPWQIDGQGDITLVGGRPPATIVEDAYRAAGRKAKLEFDEELYKGAISGENNIIKLDEALGIIENGDIDLGIGSDIANNFNRLKAQFLGDERAGSIVAQNQYLDALLGSDIFPAIDALGIGARGLDTPAERDFLIEVMTGSRKLDREALKAMTQFRKIREIKALTRYNAAVESGQLDEYFELGYPRITYEIPEMPVIDLSPIARMNTKEKRNAALADSIKEYNDAKAASIRSKEETDAAAAAAVAASSGTVRTR